MYAKKETPRKQKNNFLKKIKATSRLFALSLWHGICLESNSDRFV